ncbi:outer dense fiber protein 1 [Melospiza melodia melodia]|uniref:outer dense fiber protein 1 n=1 Tax=Melospiza melodia melodia TaxID=1914991 RepID=UPI002FD0DCFA
MAHCYLEEDSMQNLRQINRQMRLLDLRLQLLRDRLCTARMNRCVLSCCSLPSPCFRRRCVAVKNDRTKRLGMMLNSCSGQNLALIDVKGFDPKDITVTVKDGKVTVSAERKMECNTPLAKTSNYKRFVKEFCLPPGVCDKEVTYSVESKCLPPPKCCPPPKCYPYLCP